MVQKPWYSGLSFFLFLICYPKVYMSYLMGSHRTNDVDGTEKHITLIDCLRTHVNMQFDQEDPLFLYVIRNHWNTQILNVYQ